MESRVFISRFSPNRTAPEDLERIHVQRHELLENVIQRVRESVLTDAKHHLLFVGPRGCGKTHLLALLNYRLQLPAQADLADRLRIAWLNEDETSTTFLELLLRMYRALADRYPQEFPLAAIEPVYGQDIAAAQTLAASILLRALGERTALVFIENLDAHFGQLDVVEQRAWRAFLQDHPRFAMVATAQGLFAGVADRDQPFFGFFATEHLQPLSVAEATELMERIARLNEQPDLLAFLGTPRGYARVRAIHHLSGGNHRLHIVLSDFITRDSLDNLVRPFEAMVDEQLTPYYQERLRWISPQQRKIVEFLCQSAHPVSVKVIAERLFSDHNTITSQLKKLREFGYVTTNARGREARYELAEPLMRLSMQVKTAHDREPLDLLVNFLRVWYEREDLERRLGQLPLSAYGREYFETTLARSRSGEGNFCVELLRQELGDVDLKHCSDEQLETLRLVAEESGTHADRQALVVAYFCRKNYIGVVKHANRLLAMDNLSADITANALLFRGFAHGERQQIDEAIADCTRVIELPNVPAWVLDSAIGFRGTMFEKRGQREAAVADYTRLIELARAPANVIAETLIRRGSCWNNDQSEAAMADFTRVIEMPDVRITAVAEAFVNRGLRQDENGRCEDAMHDYTQAIELSDPPAGIVAVALFNRGRSHYGNNRYQAALADFTRLIEQPDVPIQLMARALFQRGVIHLRMDRSKDAMADFTRMIALVGTSEQELVCFAKAFMVLLRFSNDQWSEVQALLQNEATAEKAIRTFGSRFPDLFVESIFFKITSREMWNERARESVEIFARHHVLTQLGEALVRHITDLSKSPVGDSGYDQWFEGWQAAAAGRAEFDLPLRLLRVGIAYLKTNDEGSLLELPQEEREILRQALHLDQLTST